MCLSTLTYFSLVGLIDRSLLLELVIIYNIYSDSILKLLLAFQMTFKNVNKIDVNSANYIVNNIAVRGNVKYEKVVYKCMSRHHPC